MADEKILKDNSSKDEKISNDELEKVAGGHIHFRPLRPRRNSVIGEDNANTDTDSNQPGDKAAWNWL